MDLVSGPEIVGYFGQLMTQRFLPSGRLQYFPMSEMVDDDKFESLLSIERGGLEFFMSEQHLDHADIHLLLEQVGREAVTAMSFTT